MLLPELYQLIYHFCDKYTQLMLAITYPDKFKSNNAQNLCKYAAKNGYFELLIWAKQHKYDWNEDVCAAAALNGHLEILKYLRSHNCDWDENVYYNAAEN